MPKTWDYKDIKYLPNDIIMIRKYVNKKLKVKIISGSYDRVKKIKEMTYKLWNEVK